MQVEQSTIDKSHDPLDTKNIPGAQPNTYGWMKQFTGWDYISTNDIDGAHR